MKKNLFFKNVALAAIVAIISAAYIVVRALSPETLLPSISVPVIALLSLLSLAAAYYANPTGKNGIAAKIISAVLAGVTFGLLFWLSGITAAAAALKTGLISAAVYLASDLLYSAATPRFSDKARLAPAFTALLMFLAVQGFFGMLL